MTRGKDSRLALGRLGSLVEQLETLVRGGKQVILVTSGACLLYTRLGFTIIITQASRKNQVPASYCLGLDPSIGLLTVCLVRGAVA